MNRTLTAAALAAGLAVSAGADAREVTVTVTNITNAIYFTPLLVAAHDRDTSLFTLAESASANLQAMAEGGDTSGLAADVAAAGGQSAGGAGLLAPGASESFTIDLDGRHTRYLSIVGMLLPTNDGFVGLDSMRIPRGNRGVTVFLRGYDAGTEANDEIINGGGAPGVPGIPADPGGNGGTGGTGAAGPDHSAVVHVHRGTLGDDDSAGGVSDLDRSVHRFQNPVARVVITSHGNGHDD